MSHAFKTLNTDSVRTVGLFGGSFNPPHAAHQQVALAALHLHCLDEVWFVPVLEHPSGKVLAPYRDRIAMCELAARTLDPRVRVSYAEEETAARHGSAMAHTIDVLEYLCVARPDVEFAIVMGSDLASEVASWRRWDDIVLRARLVVIDRKSTPAISSTWIREQLARDLHNLDACVPREVLRYITEHDLYGRGAALGLDR